jgi:hypothetical protein
MNQLSSVKPKVLQLGTISIILSLVLIAIPNSYKLLFYAAIVIILLLILIFFCLYLSNILSQSLDKAGEIQFVPELAACACVTAVGQRPAVAC